MTHAGAKKYTQTTNTLGNVTVAKHRKEKLPLKWRIKHKWRHFLIELKEIIEESE